MNSITNCILKRVNTGAPAGQEVLLAYYGGAQNSNVADMSEVYYELYHLNIPNFIFTISQTPQNSDVADTSKVDRELYHLNTTNSIF